MGKIANFFDTIACDAITCTNLALKAVVTVGTAGLYNIGCAAYKAHIKTTAENKAAELADGNEVKGNKSNFMKNFSKEIKHGFLANAHIPIISKLDMHLKHSPVFKKISENISVPDSYPKQSFRDLMSNMGRAHKLKLKDSVAKFTGEEEKKTSRPAKLNNKPDINSTTHESISNNFSTVDKDALKKASQQFTNATTTTQSAHPDIQTDHQKTSQNGRSK